MLNIYYYPAEYQDLPIDAIELDTIADARNFELIWGDAARPCTIISRIPTLADSEDLLDYLPNFRKLIKELASSPHEVNFYMALHRGGLQQQPCISTVRLLANKISMWAENRWTCYKVTALGEWQVWV